MSKANLIHLPATDAVALDTFLNTGGALVAESEPHTQRWLALRDEQNADNQAIFDIFANQEGRQAHFDGQVAAALADNAASLVHGGWDGVLSGITNYAVLAASGAEADTAQKASYITLTAAPGKAEELAKFLVAGRDLVAETEPETLYWVALQSEDQSGSFAIFDLFADAGGRAKHFEGVVAAALQEQAPSLVAGGWQAVVDHVRHFDVRYHLARRV